MRVNPTHDNDLLFDAVCIATMAGPFLLGAVGLALLIQTLRLRYRRPTRKETAP
jgi:hypothetical protein